MDKINELETKQMIDRSSRLALRMQYYFMIIKHASLVNKETIASNNVAIHLFIISLGK